MNILDYANSVLYGKSLEDKLLDPSCVDDFSGECIEKDFGELFPGRSGKISFSNEQIKFPKKGSFHLDSKKALALHFFANHELLAIEIMCAAILYLDVEQNERLKIRKGILSTIKDEQKHFLLYCKRMKDFSISFGDYPVNDFFWRQFQSIKTFPEYLCVMSLTFEGANLDFASYYAKVFEEVGDLETSRILNIVYKDEISHVAFGSYWIGKWREENETIWAYFINSLPHLLTPARAKGIHYDREGRLKAGLDLDFVEKLESYKDEFKVTNRKQWT